MYGLKCLPAGDILDGGRSRNTVHSDGISQQILHHSAVFFAGQASVSSPLQHIVLPWRLSFH